MPAGATISSDGGDVWNWISSNPAPYAGTLAHQSVVASGEHQHYFYNATATLAVGGRRYLVCVRVPGSGEPAERGDAAVERRQLGASGVLGCEPDWLGHGWHGEPAVHGCVAGGGAVGAAGGTGGAGGIGRSAPSTAWPIRSTADVPPGTMPGNELCCLCCNCRRVESVVVGMACSADMNT